MRLGRRPLFFLFTAVVCLALVAPTPAAYRWVNFTMAGLGVFWGVLLAAEQVFGPGRREGANEKRPTRASGRSTR